MEWLWVFGATLAAVSVPTSLLLLLVLPRLLRSGVIDHPNVRSSHSVPTIRGAGLALIPAGVVILLVAHFAADANSLAVIGVSVGVLGGLGFADDVRHLSPVSRLMVQFVTALAVAWLLGFHGAYVLIPVLASVYSINAYNFMDGIDGISVTASALISLYWLVLASILNFTVLAVLSGALLAGALSFAPLNIPRARAFLGDSGSYYLGSLVVFGSLVVWLHASFWLAASPLLVYVADTAWTLVRRTVRSPATFGRPHRDHVYQRAARRARSHMCVTFAVGSFVMACSLVGVGISAGLLSLRAALFAHAIIVALYVARLGHISSRLCVRYRRFEWMPSSPH